MAESGLRVGVIGGGASCEEVLAAWRACRGARVVALCDVRGELAARHARGSAVEETYDSLRDMLDAGQLDVLHIALPRHSRAAAIRLAAERGLAVLCEFPVASDIGEAESLLRGLGDGFRLMVCESWRYRDYLRQVGEWLRSGRMGIVVQARIGMRRSELLKNPDGRVSALERQPSLAREPRLLVAERLVHQLDIARSLFGEVDVVAATLGSVSNDIVGDDCAVVVLQTRYGVNVVVDGALAAAGFESSSGNRLEVLGTRCSLELVHGSLHLRGAEAAVHHYDESVSKRNAFEVSIQYFVDQVVSGGTFGTPASDHLATLRLVEQVYAIAGDVALIKPQALPPYRAMSA